LDEFQSEKYSVEVKMKNWEDLMANPPDNPFETVPDPADESSRIDEIADLTKALLDKRYPPPQKVLRGVHPKSHGCVKATFRIRDDIPERLKVGLFATPGRSYDASIRFSNAAVRVAHDLAGGKNGSRGMAIKIYGVDGEMLSVDNGENNQDFLMVNSPAFAFANVEDYQRLTQTLHHDNDVPDRFFAPLQVAEPGVGPEQKERISTSFIRVSEIQSNPVENPLEVRYFSAAPFLFGSDHVMKFSAEPRDGERIQQPLDPESDANYLRIALTETLNEGADIYFDFKVQVTDKDGGFVIENASTVWDESELPFESVAEISIPAAQGDINSPESIAHCENLVFTPWHSLAVHQPIGGINRLRKKVYDASARHRGAAGD
jgi:catalase